MTALEIDYGRAPYDHELPSAPEVTIQAVDTDDETYYILRRPGHDPVAAHWPQPLLEIAPDAVRIASWQDSGVRMGIVICVGPETEFARGGSDRMGVPLKLQREKRKAPKSREQKLRLWRQARPRRFLSTGRQHNKNAKLSEEDIREIQRRHYTGYESLRSICRELWQEKGFVSDKSMLNTICDTLSSYGLRKRGQGEMTAHSNRFRSMRTEGETKNEFKRRRRRELGQAHGRICEAVKTRYGKGRGEQCQRPALDDSTFCKNHDPRYREETSDFLSSRARLGGRNERSPEREGYLRELRPNDRLACRYHVLPP